MWRARSPGRRTTPWRSLRPGNGIDSVLRVLLTFVTVQGQEVARRRVPLTGLTARSSGGRPSHTSAVTAAV